MKDPFPRSPSSTDDEIVDFAYEIYLRVGKPANLTFRQWLEAEARELGPGIGRQANADLARERSSDGAAPATASPGSETKLHPRRVELRS
jgi:hypothetical protein